MPVFVLRKCSQRVDSKSTFRAYAHNARPQTHTDITCVSGKGDPKQVRNAEHVVNEVISIARPDLRYTQLKRVSISRFTPEPLYCDCGSDSRRMKMSMS